MGNSCKNCNCKKNDEKSNNEIDAERLKDIINKFKNNPKLFKTLIKIQNIFRGMLLRSKMDANEYKDYLLSLVFYNSLETVSVKRTVSEF